MIIVSIANQKGGEGKTTTSINLADGIARRNKRTLLIDMDPQANSTGIFLNSDQIEKSMYHVFNSFAPVKEIIHKTKVENLDIAPSELKLAEMETRSSNTVEAPYILKDALSNLNNEYDICIIDCPPSLSIFTINALVASNYIIIPLQAEKFSIDGIIGLQGTVDNIKKRINPQLQILGALITQLKPQTLLTKTIVPVIVKFFRLFDTTISDGVSVGESNMARSSVYTYNKKSKQAQEYENFTEEVLNELEKVKRLGTLVDIFQAETLEGSIKKIKIDSIQPSDTQPRIDRRKAVDELAESLKQNGLLQPILITKRDGESNYRIIAGERRYHAAKSLGWTELECKILNKTEKETYKLAIIENLQRENLTPYEETEAIAFLKSNYHYTDLELAEIFGKSRSYMTEILSISTLNKDEMQICKENGIGTKNLLVQAAQASKKGDFTEFIEQIKNKEIKTVKDAKKFNKKITIESDNTLNDAIPLNTPNENHQETKSNYTITKDSNQIIIQVSNHELINKIYEFISQELANLQL